MSSLTFRFRHSRSEELPWLIELAKRGTFKELALSPKQIVYETTYQLLDPVQLGHALSLSKALHGHKSAEAFAACQSIELKQVQAVLHCYQQSQQVDDPHAHCRFHTTLQFDLTVTTFTLGLDLYKPLFFPCRLAANRVYGIHPDQPGSIPQQVESALVRAGTRWCPRLADLSAWNHAAALVNKETL